MFRLDQRLRNVGNRNLANGFSADMLRNFGALASAVTTTEESGSDEDELVASESDMGHSALTHDEDDGYNSDNAIADGLSDDIDDRAQRPQANGEYSDDDDGLSLRSEASRVTHATYQSRLGAPASLFQQQPANLPPTSLAVLIQKRHQERMQARSRQVSSERSQTDGEDESEEEVQNAPPAPPAAVPRPAKHTNGVIQAPPPVVAEMPPKAARKRSPAKPVVPRKRARKPSLTNAALPSNDATNRQSNTERAEMLNAPENIDKLLTSDAGWRRFARFVMKEVQIPDSAQPNPSLQIGVETMRAGHTICESLVLKIINSSVETHKLCCGVRRGVALESFSGRLQMTTILATIKQFAECSQFCPSIAAELDDLIRERWSADKVDAQSSEAAASEIAPSEDQDADNLISLRGFRNIFNKCHATAIAPDAIRLTRDVYMLITRRLIEMAATICNKLNSRVRISVNDIAFAAEMLFQVKFIGKSVDSEEVPDEPQNALPVVVESSNHVQRDAAVRVAVRKGRARSK